ncbi:MAG: hypothetical protein ACRENV_07665 [Candidatus Dormibacteria bacterium]
MITSLPVFPFPTESAAEAGPRTMNLMLRKGRLLSFGIARLVGLAVVKRYVENQELAS